ncbi:MAG: hypothetical protein RIS70_688 [Planctomycetota bacterium]|jgi:uncharacterized membrane protein YphA (DoxX/SURF4 family)
MSVAPTPPSNSTVAADNRPSWNRFWFTPSQPHTLALIRILGGSMLFYTHLIWSLDLEAFLGKDAWIGTSLSRELSERGMPYAWSLFWYIESPSVLWATHIAALVVFAMLTLGLFTRFSSIAAFVLTLSYCHRLQGALYGLDQVNALLATYLMIGSCGSVFSLDRLRTSRAVARTETTATVGNTIAIRLIQIHLCVIYFFGGISKLKGIDWWDGSALWMALSNYEYQSLDMTWLIGYPAIIALMTHATVIWETFYCVLIWPRYSRWIMLSTAVLVHGGIGLAMGMPTFGLSMIIANVAFLEPALVERSIARITRSRKHTAHPADSTPTLPPASKSTPRETANSERRRWKHQETTKTQASRG